MPIPPDDELTPGERADLLALPREHTPSPAVEERVVDQLRAHGVIRSTGRAGRRSARWRLLAAAAAIALFVSGFGAGKLAESGPSSPDRSLSPESDQAERIRHAGAEYVRAIVRFTDTNTANATLSDGASEAIISTLGAVAAEVLRLVPDDPLAASILTGLEWRVRSSQTNSTGVTARRVAWF